MTTINIKAGKLLLPRLVLFWAALLAAALPAAAGGVLTHRYSFDVDASDSIGGANGVLIGNAFTTNGAVVLDGTNSGVQLPANLFTNYDSITFEAWIVDLGPIPPKSSTTQSPLYEFAGSSGAMNYFDQSFVNGIPAGLGAYRTNSTSQSAYFLWPPFGMTNHFVWTQGSNSQTAGVYLNGLLVGQSTNFTLTPALVGATTVNLMGHSAANSTFFQGSILEFRVYQGALSSLDVAQSDAAGPDQPQPTLGSLQDVRVVLPASYGPGALLQPTVYADYASLSNVNVIGQPDLVLSSDNSNVLQVTGNLKIRTMALGTANITAVYQGFSNTVPVAVVVPQDYTLAHRYSFGEPNTQWVAHDSVGTAHGRLNGTSGPGGLPASARFTGSGTLSLNGGYAALPPGLVSSQSEVTIEAWVNYSHTTGGDPGYPPNWARIFDFGNIVGTQGSTYLFLTPSVGVGFNSPPGVMRATITTNGNGFEHPKLDWTNTLPTNVMSHLAVSYSLARGMAKLYLNGVPVASGVATIPLAGVIDTNNWLGKSQFASDPLLVGQYDEFRIYNGFLQDGDIAVDYAAGPNVIGTDFLLKSSVSNANLTLSWGPAMADWSLQSSPTVDSNAVWTPVNATTNFQDNHYSVTLPVSGDTNFFRLQQGQ